MMEQDIHTSDRHLTIRNLGPIHLADINMKRVNVVIGEQSSGKSCLLKTASYCAKVEERIKIEQSADYFKQGDAFIRLFIQFHKMGDFVNDETEIAYESGYMRFSYVHKQREFSFDWKSCRWEYERPKVSYIPSERNLVAAIPNWFQVTFDNNNMKEFMADWEDARKSMSKGYDVLNLGISYYYDPSNKSDRVRINNAKTIHFSNSSSGLQSLIPLLVLLNYITSDEYRQENNHNFDKSQERGKVLIALTKYYREHLDELRSLVSVGKDERLIWDDGFGNTQYHQAVIDMFPSISLQPTIVTYSSKNQSKISFLPLRGYSSITLWN